MSQELETHLHEEETPRAAPACGKCEADLRPNILLGDLRFFVCKVCGSWAAPFPPAKLRSEGYRQAS
ncbi:MAG TPA: hypothetical protein DEV93_16965 [Chloroflexi bacterium]|nr:hypothetical protein [Chloroflexota bacterium]